jgi:hypothetical protein
MTTATLEGDEIVIRIPRSGLTTGAEIAWDRYSAPEKYFVENVDEFAESMIHELNNENEIGETLVHDMLDKAAMKVLDNGQPGVGERSREDQETRISGMTAAERAADFAAGQEAHGIGKPSAFQRLDYVKITGGQFAGERGRIHEVYGQSYGVKLLTGKEEDLQQQGTFVAEENQLERDNEPLLSACDKCGTVYPSAPAGTIHKCGLCSGGYCSRLEYEKRKAAGTLTDDLGFIDRADVPVGEMRRSIHRSHRAEGKNFVD